MKKIGVTIAVQLCILSLGLTLAGCGDGVHGSDGGGGGGGSGSGNDDLSMAVQDMAAPAQPSDDMAAVGGSQDLAGMPDGNGITGASVRFINAGSARLLGKDAHMLYSFDVYLAGGSAPIASNIAFGQCSPWVSVASGQPLKFDLRQAGADPASTALFTTADADALNLPGGGHGSVVIYGFSKTTSGGFKLLNLTDGFVVPATGAVARFVNVTPAESTYKVYLDPKGAPIVQVMKHAASDPPGKPLPAGGAAVPLLITNSVGNSSMFPASGDATWTLPPSFTADGKQLLVIVTGQGIAGLSATRPPGY